VTEHSHDSKLTHTFSDTTPSVLRCCWLSIRKAMRPIKVLNNAQGFTFGTPVLTWSKGPCPVHIECSSECCGHVWICNVTALRSSTQDSAGVVSAAAECCGALHVNSAEIQTRSSRVLRVGGSARSVKTVIAFNESDYNRQERRAYLCEYSCSANGA